MFAIGNQREYISHWKTNLNPIHFQKGSLLSHNRYYAITSFNFVEICTCIHGYCIKWYKRCNPYPDWKINGFSQFIDDVRSILFAYLVKIILIYQLF